MEHKIIPCVEGDDEFIADKLNAITDSKIDFEDTIEDELVVFKVTDSDGNIIAGCNLIIYCWKVADLDILWVEEKYRKQGIGSALIREAERAARKRGCHFMTLGTFDFQARPLYEKHGFAVCGTIEDCPTKGHTHFDMINGLTILPMRVLPPLPAHLRFSQVIRTMPSTLTINSLNTTGHRCLLCMALNISEERFRAITTNH